MEFFKWDVNYLTGIDFVDLQHRKLVDILNDFIGALTREEVIEKEDIYSFFTLLNDYANHHFQEEEALMLDAGIDPRFFTPHQQQHLTYIHEITREQTGITEDPDAAKTLLSFLGQWLIHHILGLDQSMARQIASIRAGLSPAEAYAQEKPAQDKTSDPLLHALNAMVEQVMARNAQLVRINESLEARVAERTQALQEANERLQQIAQTDVLTGLPNRRHAMERLTQFWSESIRHSTPFSCIMLDADGFKQVNDTYGHDAGDVVLCELAATLRAFTRTEDFVCRLGGDEFLILCPQTNQLGASKLAENLRLKVNSLRVPTGAGEWRGSLSLGVAERNPAFEKPDDLINAADKGLYVAKRNGRNQVGIASEE